jgi:hypothetical protein
LPELVAVTHELEQKGVALVTIVVSGRKTAITEAAQKAGLNAPILIGSDAINVRWQVSAVPWTVIVGKDGKAAEVLRGAHGAATFREAIGRHL